MSLSTAGPIAEMNMGEAESRNSNSATVGAGSEDWVNAMSVPRQPYCGRTALSSTEGLLQGSVTQEDAKCGGDQAAALPLCRSGGVPLRGELRVPARRCV